MFCLKRRGWTAASGSGGWLMLIWGCYRQPPYLLSELPSPMIIQWHNTWWQTGLGKIIRGIYWGVKIRILAHADNPALGRVRYQQEHCDHFNKSADQNFKMPPENSISTKSTIPVHISFFPFLIKLSEITVKLTLTEKVQVKLSHYLLWWSSC